MNIGIGRYSIFLILLLTTMGCGDQHPSSADSLELNTHGHTFKNPHYIGVQTESGLAHAVTIKKTELLKLNGLKDTFNSRIFGGVERSFAVRRIRNLPSGGYSWFGRVDGDPYSHFSVTYRNGHAVGSAMIQGQSYTLRTDGSGDVIVSASGMDDVHCSNDTHSHGHTQEHSQ
jgi:hypothetical protein